MKLPQLAPQHIQTWFDDFCDPRNMHHPPRGQATLTLRKAPHVPAQKFALPSQLDKAVRGILPAEKLPPLRQHVINKQTSSNVYDVMEGPERMSSLKGPLFRLLSIPDADGESCSGRASTIRSLLSAGMGSGVRLEGSLQYPSEEAYQQPVPTLLAAIPSSHTSSGKIPPLLPAACSEQASSTTIFPGNSGGVLLTSRLNGESIVHSPRAATASDEWGGHATTRVKQCLGGISAMPRILQCVDIMQPLLAMPPPGGWYGEEAVAMAMDEVRTAAVEELDGQGSSGRKTTVKHSVAQRRTNGQPGEGRATQREAKPSKMVETSAKMWRSRSVKSWRPSGRASRKSSVISPIVLGSYLARGTPTPKPWLKRHGDQRVPVMLTVDSNHIPYRLPSKLQEAMRTELQAAERAAEAASRPTEVLSRGAMGMGAQPGAQNVPDAGDNQTLLISKTFSAGSRGSRRERDLAPSLSRCMSAASGRSALSASSLPQKNQEEGGSREL